VVVVFNASQRSQSPQSRTAAVKHSLGDVIWRNLCVDEEQAAADQGLAPPDTAHPDAVLEAERDPRARTSGRCANRRSILLDQ
jgi:hypothetical protein